MKAGRPVYVVCLVALFSPKSSLSAIAQNTGEQKERCLEIQVLDPSSASMQGATVTIGDREERTGDSGVASFCGLGAGPHWVIVSAGNFQVDEGSVDESEGRVTVVLQARLETEQVVVVAAARSRGR